MEFIVITNTKNGDIIDFFKQDTVDGIIHGCNCFCVMGGGVAKDIRVNFPQAYAADLNTESGDKNKLGTYSYAVTPFGVVINAYTQYDMSTGQDVVDYDAVRQVFTNLNERYANKHFAIPKIGAGLARGNWDTIESIINETTPDLELTLILL